MTGDALLWLLAHPRTYLGTIAISVGACLLVLVLDLSAPPRK